MSSNITGQQFLLLVFGALVLYYSLLALLCRGKSKSSMMAATLSPLPHQLTIRPADLVGRAIEPVVIPLEFAYDPFWEDETTVQLLDDEDSILVREAEKVVEGIHRVLAEIAPATPAAVDIQRSVSAVLSSFKLFDNTEYYEAINAFISESVEAAFGLRWTAEDIQLLWQ